MLDFIVTQLTLLEYKSGKGEVYRLYFPSLLLKRSHPRYSIVVYARLPRVTQAWGDASTKVHQFESPAEATLDGDESADPEKSVDGKSNWPTGTGSY